MSHDDHFPALPEDVIAFAWSAPMRDLARTIGISDVGLRKLLRAQGIDTPPQGHWNRVHAGRPVPPPPGPRPRGPGETGRIRLDGRFRDHIPEAEPMPVGGPFASASVPEDLDELKTRALGEIGKIPVPRDLARPHPGLSDVLKREEKRRTKFAASSWNWDRPAHDHPLAQRQLRIANALLKALARLDHSGSLREGETGFELYTAIGDTGFTLTIERAAEGRKRPGRLMDREVRQLPASTPLAIALSRTWSSNLLAMWRDGTGCRVEHQLPEIVANLVVSGEAAFRRSLVKAVEAEQQRIRWRQEIRRQEIARLEEKRLADLRSSGELLRQAEEIRALVARVENAVVERQVFGVSAEQVARWKQWALSKADELDPVSSGQVLAHLHVPGLDDDRPGEIEPGNASARS